MIDAPARLDARLADEARALVADSVTRSALVGALAGAVLAAAAGVTGQGATIRFLAAVAPTVAAALVGYWRGRGRWTRAAAADALERRHPADNLVVTAEALTRTGSHPWQAVVSAAAWSRIERLPPLSMRAAWTRAAVAVVLATAAAMMPWPARAVGTGAGSDRSDGAVSAGDALLTSFSVVVSPPPYLGGESAEHRDATAVEVVAGGRVEVRAGTTAATVRLARDGAAPLVAAADQGIAAATLPEPPDGTWVISAGPAEPGSGARLLTVRIVADAPPLVRIVEPGRDRRLARPLADLPVAIEARDDHGLRDLGLRVTTVSGGGENLTFADRDVAARVSRAAPGAWTASAIVPLAALDLADGDLVVYRAVAADGRPGAPAIESDAFIVEVGPLRAASDAAGGGEDVDPEQRQAISQQMVIVKTERLDARGAGLPPDVRLAEAQGLAVEQRMVRAEFVFLMGGDVQDEIEEAAHAHDLVEGRLANQGQAALLAATRAMSRAEARLTAGDTAAALVAERDALRFLQQAFDRRRYLLRPVAERARIDPSRRLQGPPASGPSLAWPMAAPDLPAGRDALERAASLLARAQRDPAADLVVPAARLAALDPADPRAAAAAVGAGPRGDAPGPHRRAGGGAAHRAGGRDPAAAAAGGGHARRRDLGRHRRCDPTEPAVNWLRLGAWAIAIAAVVDPAVERRELPPAIVGVRVVTAWPSPDADAFVERMTERLGGRAVVAREAPMADGRWCAGANVCVAVTDGTAAPGAQPAAPVHVVQIAPPPVAQVVAAQVPPGHLAEMSEVRAAIAGGRAGAVVELVVEDDGVEVGRLAHTRTARAIDAEVVVPWWPRRDGLRLVSVRVEDVTGRGPGPAAVVADTAAAPLEVLLWEGRPSWTGTFLRRALQEDPRLAVRVASRIAPTRVVRRGLSGAPGDDDLRRARAVVVTGAVGLDRSPSPGSIATRGPVARWWSRSTSGPPGPCWR